MRRWQSWVTCVLLGLLLAGCASTGEQAAELQRAQYAWSAAIRWGDFEGAWQMVDPARRESHPLGELEFERYRQVQVSHYRELADRPGEAEAAREIEIGLINRHTMAERTLRYTEQWRYDPAAATWWITGGLPDFWAGE